MVIVQAPQFIDLLKNIIPFFQAPNYCPWCNNYELRITYSPLGMKTAERGVSPLRIILRCLNYGKKQ
jgi:hypothetical protein